MKDNPHPYTSRFAVMDAEKNQSPLQVLMFPWLAYGHITPYLELAKKLTTRGFIIHLCSTPATLTCIEKKITENFSKSINLVPLLLPDSPELPHELHTTNGLPPHLMTRLKESFDSSVDDFSNILAKLKPDLLIYDFLQTRAPLVAKDQNIPAVEFITSSSTMTCLMFHYFINPQVDFPFPEIYFREYESCHMTRLLETAKNEERRERASAGFERSSNIVLIKGFREIEGKYIDYVTKLVGKRFFPVGPLVQDPKQCHDEKDHDLDYDYDMLRSWLDEKDEKSTIFVSFGSEYFLTEEDLHEIANGLELSNVNFIWVVRFPKGSSSNGQNGNFTSLEKALPRGFIERVGERGKILEGWAPQTKILQHRNIGGFVSHCGWNSVLESMNFGVPIIAVPMHLDQPINARLVEEVGVGIEVLRDKYKNLDRQTVAKVIRQVVVEDSGDIVRKSAFEMSKKMRAKGDQEIDEVVREIVGLCKKSSIKNI